MNTQEPFDHRNATLLRTLIAELDADEGVRCGDFVIFAGGVTRRVSYVWRYPGHPDWCDVQTSDDGSFHLGHGYVSFSGSLYSQVPASALTLTDEKRAGRCWFWRDDCPGADRGLNAIVMFRVYRCSGKAPR